MVHPRRHHKRNSAKIKHSSSSSSSSSSGSMHRPLSGMVPVCLLAVVCLLRLRFGSCDERASRHVLDAVAWGAPLSRPRDSATTGGADCTRSRVGCEQCQARKLSEGRGGVSSVLCPSRLLHQAWSQRSASVTDVGAATVEALGVRGSGRGNGRSDTAHILQSERESRIATAFVARSGLPADAHLDFRPKNNRRVDGFTTRGAPFSAPRTTPHQQRHRRQRRIRVGDLTLRAGSAARSPTHPQGTIGWGAAKSRRAPPTTKMLSPGQPENKNSLLCSISRGSLRPRTTSSSKPGEFFMSGVTSPGEAGDGRDARPPLLITIGPQCSGKTTLLKQLAARGKQRAGIDRGEDLSVAVTTVTDVAIDDHPSVYHKIPLSCLVQSEGLGEEAEEDIVVRGRRLSERLAEPGCRETRLVALRLLGMISEQEFALTCKESRGKASPEALDALSTAVHSAVAEGVEISTATVDIFVRESLFPGAISSSQRKLERAARDGRGLVAWGNTNAQASDFRKALAQAELTRRPVRFLRWGYELPFLSLGELSRRNVYRFASTGRYVEIAVIETALRRIERLYAATGGGDPVQLALAAGFHMDASGRVISLPSAPSKTIPRKRIMGGQGVDAGTLGGRRRRGVARDLGQAGAGRASELDSGGHGSQTVGDDEAETINLLNSYGWSPGRRNNGALADLVEKRSLASSGVVRGDVRSLLASPQRQASAAARTGSYCNPEKDYPRIIAESKDADVPLRLAQEWRPREDVDPWSRGGTSAMGIASRGMAAKVKPPTVAFGSEWGRKRDWRRESYTESDLDPMMSSCYFKAPVNGTRTLRRNDGDHAMADYEEMDLIRRIKSVRERR